MPDAVRLLHYIRVRTVSQSMTVVKRVCVEPVELFRIDAKAEGEKVVIGGWESFGGGDAEGARWFSMTLDRKSAYTKRRALQKHSSPGGCSPSGGEAVLLQRETKAPQRGDEIDSVHGQRLKHLCRKEIS